MPFLQISEKLPETHMQVGQRILLVWFASVSTPLTQTGLPLHLLGSNNQDGDSQNIKCKALK